MWSKLRLVPCSPLRADNANNVDANPNRERLLRLARTYSPIAVSLVTFVFIGLALALLHLGAPIVNPILFAFFLFALALPLFRWLEQKGLNKFIALVSLVATILIGGIGLALLALFSVGVMQEGLSSYSEQLSAQLGAAQASLQSVGIPLSVQVRQLANDVMSALLAFFLGAIAEVAGSFIFSVVLVAFMLLEFNRFRTILNTRMRDVPFWGDLPVLAQTAIRYFGIRTRLNLLTALGMTILLLLLGVDYALLWGIWGFFLSYIPFIGLLVAMIPPALLAFAEYGWLQAALVLLGITIMNLAIENIVEPTYTGKILRLSPTIVFISFFFWGWLLGPVGALMSMPITVLLMLVLGRSESTRSFAEILGRKG